MSLFTYLMVVINRMFENNVIIIIVFLVYHFIRYFEVFLMYQLLGTQSCMFIIEARNHGTMSIQLMLYNTFP